MATIKRSALWGAVAIFLLPVASCSCPPTPSVSSISPSSATAGGVGFVLTVNGGNFRSNSVVIWNGTALVTTFVSSSQLTATVTETNIAQPDRVVVYVYNPASQNEVSPTTATTATNTNQCGSPGSNALSFTVSP